MPFCRMTHGRKGPTGYLYKCVVWVMDINKLLYYVSQLVHDRKIADQNSVTEELPAKPQVLYKFVEMKSVLAWRFVFLLLFLGWLFIWIMLPTKTYKNAWTPKLKRSLSSTYFREQGTNLLLFTFPVMLIAALGCVYLHFREKSKITSYAERANNSHDCQLSRKRPVLVVAPLGIVNATELGFTAMFFALLIWSLANYLYVSFGHLHMDKPGVEVWQLKFRSVSLRLGYIGNICWAFLFFPVTRGSSILPLVGLSSESSIKYHIWLGHVSTILFAAHSIGFIVYWGMTHQMAQMLEWSRTYVPNIAGVIAFVFSLGMWVTSLYPVRRKKFELFFYIHHLYILYLFFYILHVGVAYFCMILPGVFLFLVDRYIRFLQSRQRTRLVSARLLPCGTTELTFSKNPGVKYNPTSTLFLNVPSISRLQWHPFTIISNCNMEPDQLSVAIKSQGSWSQKLYKELSSSSSSSVNCLQVSTEGPYGPLSFHLLRHEALVMISGGSGITPFISIIREFIYRSMQQNCKVPKVVLVAAFKNASDISNLDLLLPGSCTSIDISQIQLEIDAYITREKEQPTSDEAHKHLQTTTIWFKPSPEDLPISAAIGPNSWLWLCAIISTSFVMFLLFLTIVTHYWIYPTEKRGEIYHYSLKSLWDMFLVCACIFVATSVIFLFQKRRNSISERTQIQNVELRTPTASSAGSWLCGGGGTNTDRELESLPCQPLVEVTRVHFGSRPDLKRILFNFKESDVGVLVSGPRKMRHEVARICSSGLAKNLHCESMSFNW